MYGSLSDRIGASILRIVARCVASAERFNSSTIPRRRAHKWRDRVRRSAIATMVFRCASAMGRTPWVPSVSQTAQSDRSVLAVLTNANARAGSCRATAPRSLDQLESSSAAGLHKRVQNWHAHAVNELRRRNKLCRRRFGLRIRGGAELRPKPLFVRGRGLALSNAAAKDGTRYGVTSKVGSSGSLAEPRRPTWAATRRFMRGP